MASRFWKVHVFNACKEENEYTVVFCMEPEYQKVTLLQQKCRELGKSRKENNDKLFLYAFLKVFFK